LAPFNRHSSFSGPTAENRGKEKGKKKKRERRREKTWTLAAVWSDYSSLRKEHKRLKEERREKEKKEEKRGTHTRHTLPPHIHL